MFTYNSFVVALFISVVVFLINTLPATESATTVLNIPSPTRYPIVYRRYIRRRPPIYPTDEYSEDILEIYNTKAKPPAYNSLTDEEVDRFIFCDFSRHLEECKCS